MCDIERGPVFRRISGGTIAHLRLSVARPPGRRVRRWRRRRRRISGGTRSAGATSGTRADRWLVLLRNRRRRAGYVPAAQICSGSCTGWHSCFSGMRGATMFFATAVPEGCQRPAALPRGIIVIGVASRLRRARRAPGACPLWLRGRQRPAALPGNPGVLAARASHPALAAWTLLPVCIGVWGLGGISVRAHPHCRILKARGVTINGPLHSVGCEERPNVGRCGTTTWRAHSRTVHDALRVVVSAVYTVRSLVARAYSLEF